MIPQPRRTAARQEVDESYQVDAIVSLFAVLLVMLLALAAAGAQNINPVETSYRPDDPPGRDFVLNSLQVPYRFRQFWIVDDLGQLIEVDTAAIIERLGPVNAGDKVETTFDGVDIRLEISARELSAFRLGVDVWDKDRGAWAIAQRIDVDDTDALAEWAGIGNPAIVVVKNGAAAAAARVAAALRDGIRPGSLLIPRNDTRYATVVRSASGFSLEGVYRAH